MTQQDIKSIFRPSLFWDAEEIDVLKHAGYVIARILDYGNEKDIKKLLEIYPKEEIIRIVKTRRGLLPKVREVACLRKYYQDKH